MPPLLSQQHLTPLSHGHRIGPAGPLTMKVSYIFQQINIVG